MTSFYHATVSAFWTEESPIFGRGALVWIVRRLALEDREMPLSDASGAAELMDEHRELASAWFANFTDATKPLYL